MSTAAWPVNRSSMWSLQNTGITPHSTKESFTIDISGKSLFSRLVPVVSRKHSTLMFIKASFVHPISPSYPLVTSESLFRFVSLRVDHLPGFCSNRIQPHSMTLEHSIQWPWDPPCLPQWRGQGSRKSLPTSSSINCLWVFCWAPNWPSVLWHLSIFAGKDLDLGIPFLWPCPTPFWALYWPPFCFPTTQSPSEGPAWHRVLKKGCNSDKDFRWVWVRSGLPGICFIIGVAPPTCQQKKKRNFKINFDISKDSKYKG